MIQNLPAHGFLWKKVEDFTPEKIDELVKKDMKGYLLEVDVEYPKELDENHNELPSLAERMKIGREEKLVPNVRDKKEYVVHIKKLNQALRHDLKLKKSHRVIEFQHSNWMKPYIMLNTRLRTAAKNGFEKDFFKLMNNSVFGKTMKKMVGHFPKHLFAVDMGKTEIKMSKPVHLGQAILDLSKTVMYEFHYDYIRPKYGSKVKLCYMDTDSFVYEIGTEHFYRDIAKDVEKRFDTNGY